VPVGLSDLSGTIINEIASLAMGGTLSGKHGFGMLKRPSMEKALGSISIDVQGHIKQALDPFSKLQTQKEY
jgi:glycolate oxidase